MEQIVDAVPLVPLLDDPVPQMVEQLPNLLQFFAALSPVPEQVIAVAKILPHEVPPRRLCSDTQLAEQLVEVPTILYFLKQRIPEQIDDNPVPHGGRGASGGLQSFLPGHSSLKRTANKIAYLPAPRSGVRRLQGFLPEQSSSSSSHDPARGFEALDEPGYGFFRTFPQFQKSATQPPHSGSEMPPHSSPWTPAAYDTSMVLEEEAEEEEEPEDEPVEFVEYVQHDGHWWGCEWDPAHQRHCWWLAGCGGLHGSSAVGHGDVATMVFLGWCLVRQWIPVPASTYCGGASFSSSSKWLILLLFTETGTHSANLLCCSDLYPQCKLCRLPSRFSRCCSWTGFLTCPLLCSATCTVLGCQGRRHLRRGADAVSYGPDCSEKHRDSRVAVHQ